MQKVFYTQHTMMVYLIILFSLISKKEKKSLTKVHVFTELWNMHLDTANKKL